MLKEIDWDAVPMGSAQSTVNVKIQKTMKKHLVKSCKVNDFFCWDEAVDIASESDEIIRCKEFCGNHETCINA